MIKGKRIILRALEHKDLGQLRDWRNSPDIRIRTREYRLLNMTNQEKWFLGLQRKPPESIMFGVIERELQSLIGVCGLVHIDWVNRSAEISLYMGEKKNMGKGYGTEAVEILLKYGFDTLNLHRIWHEAYALPEGYGVPGKLFLKCGFKLDGKLRHTVFRMGKYYDSQLYSILKEEWSKQVSIHSKS